MIISSADELTPEWFTRHLGDHQSTVTAVQLEPLGSGAMCRMPRALLIWDRSLDRSESLIVKFPTADASTLALATGMQMYELEVRFYRVLLPHLPGLRVPASHLAEINETTGAFTLILEDLRAQSRPETYSRRAAATIAE